MTQAVLSARGLVRTRGDVSIVDGVDLDVQAGDTMALVGTSGCGKTTLLHMLGILDQPSAGHLTFAGQDPWTLGPRERSSLRLGHVGFVFQLSNLLPHLTTHENVALPAWRQSGNRRVALARAEELIRRFGLSARMHARAGSLSLGEAQRVAVARALVNRPALILADEPTGSLDSESSNVVVETLLDARRDGTALIVVTHDENVARRFDTILRMTDGRISVERARDNVCTLAEGRAGPGGVVS